MSNQLMTRDDARLTVTFTPDALELKESALGMSALIGRVTTPEEQAESVAAQMELKRVRLLAESSRVAAKAPVLEYGRRIDTAAKTFCEDIDRELMRHAKMCGDFQTLEQAKARAAEAARLKELAEIERKKFEAIAQARNHEEIEAIQERACEEAKAVPVIQPSKAQGQVVGEEWEFEVLDVHALYRDFPTCLKLEPVRSEIKRLLNAGHKLPGVKAEKKTKSSVRLPSGKALVEV